MAGTLNKVMLIGNLGKDPEARRFENGGMLVKFPIATTENFTDRDGNRKESTEWHTIVVRSPRLAEVCERFLHKGDKVFIEGKIRSSQWTDEDVGAGLLRSLGDFVRGTCACQGARGNRGPGGSDKSD